MTPKRVFILGLQRSGTTWLANMLAALPEVAAVEDDRHRGVHESVFFSHFTKAFDPWDDVGARARFFKAFATSDYVALSGIEPELIEEFEGTKQSYGDVFVSFMDLLALVEGADAWIEKSPHHTLLADDILSAAPDALFVMVTRDAKNLVQSRLQGFGRTPKRGLKRFADIARGAMTSALYTRTMRGLAKRSNALLVAYEDLKSDPDHQTRQRILNHIGLDASPADMVSQYSANTSFDGAEKQAWTKTDDAVLTIAKAISAVIPLGVLAWLSAWRDRKRGVVFPDWVWTINPEGADQKDAPQMTIILDEQVE